MHSPASNIDKSPYEVKCHIRAQCEGEPNGPQEIIGYIGYFFAFYATKMGSRDSGETKVNPNMVQDPPWSFNGPCHGPTRYPHGPLYIGYIFAFYATKMGSRDSGDTKVNPHWV